MTSSISNDNALWLTKIHGIFGDNIPEELKEKAKTDAKIVYAVLKRLSENEPVKTSNFTMERPDGWELVPSIEIQDETYFTAKWDPKMWNKTTKEQHTFEGHEGEVLSFHVAGNRLATGSRDNTARLWDTDSKECLQVFRGHTGAINDVKVVGPGFLLDKDVSLLRLPRVYTGSQDGLIKVWNQATGDCVETYEGHKGAVITLLVAARFLYSGSYDNTAKKWDTTTGECVKTYFAVSGGISALAVTEKHLLTGTLNHQLIVWNIDTGKALYRLPSEGEVRATAVYWNRVFYADVNGNVNMSNMETGWTCKILTGKCINPGIKLIWSSELNQLIVRSGTSGVTVDFNPQAEEKV